jgi:hypothetical protein
MAEEINNRKTVPKRKTQDQLQDSLQDPTVVKAAGEIGEPRESHAMLRFESEIRKSG